MLKPNSYSQEKLEQLLAVMGYKVRYEKGNFRSGACVLQDKKVVVVNKFATIDNKIHSLIEIVQQIELEAPIADEKMQAFYHSLKQTQLEI